MPIRNERVSKGSDGVVIHLRSTLTMLFLTLLLPTLAPEYILIEINLNSVKFLLAVVYSPPTVDYFDAFELLIEQHLPFYEHNLMDDFNTCCKRSKKL